MPDQHADSEAYLSRAASGDKSARAKLLELYRARLNRMVAVRLDRRLRQRIDPSDIIQETLIVADRRLDEYLRDQPIPFYPWLRQLAWDQLVTALRRHVFAGRRSRSREEVVVPALSDESVAELATCLVDHSADPFRKLLKAEVHGRLHEVRLSLSSRTVKSWFCDTYGQTSGVPTGSDFVAVAAGWVHNLALRADGSLVGWGLHAYGATIVPAGNDFVAIAAGNSHSLALRADGSLVAWGYNLYGQTNVPAGNDYVAIAAGTYHNLALRVDGSLVAWGQSIYGETDVPAGNDFVAIAAGSFLSLALRADGSLVSWGWNFYGQTDVPAGNDFVAIAAGAVHGLALRADGSLVSWGYNVDGETNVPAGNDFVLIAAGGVHSLALKLDGSLVNWGTIHIWETGEQLVPSAPAGFSFVSIAAGLSGGVAIGPPGPKLITDLIQQLLELNLKHGIENSLHSKLDTSFQALVDVNTNNDISAIHALNAFIHAGQAQSGKGIPTADAEALIAAAFDIIHELRN